MSTSAMSELPRRGRSKGLAAAAGRLAEPLHEDRMPCLVVRWLLGMGLARERSMAVFFSGAWCSTLVPRHYRFRVWRALVTGRRNPSDAQADGEHESSRRLSGQMVRGGHAGCHGAGGWEGDLQLCLRRARWRPPLTLLHSVSLGLGSEDAAKLSSVSWTASALTSCPH